MMQGRSFFSVAVKQVTQGIVLRAVVVVVKLGHDRSQLAARVT